MAREVKKQLKVFEVRQMCECGGEFLPTGNVFTICPPKFEHQCNKCQLTETFETSYPTVGYEDYES